MGLDPFYSFFDDPIPFPLPLEPINSTKVFIKRREGCVKKTQVVLYMSMGELLFKTLRLSLPFFLKKVFQTDNFLKNCFDL